MWSATCLWLTRHWPFSTLGRTWPVYLWLIGQGGPAFVREIYPDGIPSADHQ
jgi:hypothetical protein